MVRAIAARRRHSAVGEASAANAPEQPARAAMNGHPDAPNSGYGAVTF